MIVKRGCCDHRIAISHSMRRGGMSGFGGGMRIGELVVSPDGTVVAPETAIPSMPGADGSVQGAVTAAANAGSMWASLVPVDNPNSVIQYRTVVNGALAGVTAWALIKVLNFMGGGKKR